MKKGLKAQKGFTLIELVMVIAILAVLAAVAIPIYVDLQSEAETSAEQGVVGGVRAGIMTYFVKPANNKTYPSALDAVDASGGAVVCSAANPCFVTVLQQGGITSGWTKASATTYTGPAGTTYTYTSSTGSFS